MKQPYEHRGLLCHRALCSSSRQEKEAKVKELTRYEECESFLRNVNSILVRTVTNGQPLDIQCGGCRVGARDESIYGWTFSSTLNKARILMEKEKLGSIAGGNWQCLPQLRY